MAKELIGADFLGQTVDKGDLVVFRKPNSNDLQHGKVIKITKKGATVEYGKGSTCNRPNYGLLKLSGDAVDQIALNRLGLATIQTDNVPKED